MPDIYRIEYILLTLCTFLLYFTHIILSMNSMNQSHSPEVIAISNPKMAQIEKAEISSAVAVGAACVIGFVSAATEVDRCEDNKMKREPK